MPAGRAKLGAVAFDGSVAKCLAVETAHWRRDIRAYPKGVPPGVDSWRKRVKFESKNK